VPFWLLASRPSKSLQTNNIRTVKSLA